MLLRAGSTVPALSFTVNKTVDATVQPAYQSGVIGASDTNVHWMPVSGDGGQSGADSVASGESGRVLQLQLYAVALGTVQSVVVCLIMSIVMIAIAVMHADPLEGKDTPPALPVGPQPFRKATVESSPAASSDDAATAAAISELDEVAVVTAQSVNGAFRVDNIATCEGMSAGLYRLHVSDATVRVVALLLVFRGRNCYDVYPDPM